MALLLDIQGKRFGRLLVLQPLGTDRRGQAQWECLCDCGKTLTVASRHLNSGNSESCGCLAREKTSKRFAREIVGYGGAHARVHQARGNASRYRCNSCAEVARDWAYDHADPDELTGPNARGFPVPYSLSIDHYLPLCRTCHRRFDVNTRSVK